MSSTMSQPGATPIPDSLVAQLLETLPDAGSTDPGRVRVRYLDVYSNDLAEVRLPDGRTLMVKRGRYGWARSRYEVSRRASGLLRDRRAAVVPEPLPIPEGLDDRPLEAYWRIDLPTLQEAWPRLSAAQRERALRSWGRLLRRVHQIHLPGHGPLTDDALVGSLQATLRADLEERLLPAVWAEWPEGSEPVERLLGALPSLAAAVGDRPAVLIHHDMHMGNVLCEPDDQGVRCVGLLDLETCRAGLAEADLAGAEVHHGPLFSQPLAAGWTQLLHQGYDAALHPLALDFYRSYHLANMGFYSALVGHHEHAAEVGAALRAGIASLEARAA